MRLALFLCHKVQGARGPETQRKKASIRKWKMKDFQKRLTSTQFLFHSVVVRFADIGSLSHAALFRIPSMSILGCGTRAYTILAPSKLMSGERASRAAWPRPPPDALHKRRCLILPIGIFLDLLNSFSFFQGQYILH